MRFFVHRLAVILSLFSVCSGVECEMEVDMCIAEMEECNKTGTMEDCLKKSAECKTKIDKLQKCLEDVDAKFEEKRMACEEKAKQACLTNATSEQVDECYIEVETLLAELQTCFNNATTQKDCDALDEQFVMALRGCNDLHVKVEAALAEAASCRSEFIQKCVSGEAETTTEKSQKTESTGAAKISESSRTAQQTKSTSTAKISEPSGTARTVQLLLPGWTAVGSASYMVIRLLEYF